MATVLGLALFTPISSFTAPEAQAVGAFSNAAIADTALHYVGQNGARACEAAGLGTNPGGIAGGECKTFVNCVVKLASGGRTTIGGGYYSDYQRAGGVLVSSADARKGDIIQLNGPARDSFYTGMHTAIVVSNNGGGSFSVVDSNFGFDRMVQNHSFTPATQAARYGLTVNIWRLGQVTAPRPPTTLTLTAGLYDPADGRAINLNPVHRQRPLTVQVFNQVGQKVLDNTVTATQNGARYTATLDASGLGTGYYQVKIRLDYTLFKLVQGITTITQGQPLALPAASVTAGDVNQDNAVSVADYTIITGCYSDLAPARDCDPARKRAADLNDDGSVNGIDQNLYLRIQRAGPGSS